MMAKHFMKSPVIHEMRVVGGDIKGSHIIEKLDQVNGKTKIFVDASINVSKRTKISFKKSNYEDEIKKLESLFQIKQTIDLHPYDKDHAMVIATSLG